MHPLPNSCLANRALACAQIQERRSNGLANQERNMIVEKCILMKLNLGVALQLIVAVKVWGNAKNAMT